MQEKFEKIIFWKQPCICTFATYFLNEIMMSNFCRVFLNETFLEKMIEFKRPELISELTSLFLIFVGTRTGGRVG